MLLPLKKLDKQDIQAKQSKLFTATDEKDKPDTNSKKNQAQKEASMNTITTRKNYN